MENNFIDGEWVKFSKGLVKIRKEANNPDCKHDFVTFYPSYRPNSVPEPRAICTKCSSEFEMLDEKQRYTVVNDLKKIDLISDAIRNADGTDMHTSFYIKIKQIMGERE